jgi:hypothetical protein
MTTLGPVVYDDIAGDIVKKRTVQVVLYPHDSYASLSLDAARHLYRLLQRYNWCVSEPDKYPARWGTFWPSISAVERKVISLFVMANYAGQFGMILELRDLQDDFERVVLTSHVEKEFHNVLCGFYKLFIAEKDVDAWLSEHCQKDHKRLVLFGAAKLAFVKGCFEPERFHQRCRDALLSLGVGTDMADTTSTTLNLCLQDFVMIKEMNVWA